jgi:DNA-binding MarR family transcriptional regulator
MRNLLALVSKIHEKGNRFIIEQLKKNGADGLVPSHGDILVCLYEQDKMTMKDIADKIHRTRPTVTVLVDKLEKLGYIKREISQEDSRYTYIVLTKKGQDFKPIFEKISEDLNNLLYKNLTEQESNILDNLLQKI